MVLAGLLQRADHGVEGLPAHPARQPRIRAGRAQRVEQPVDVALGEHRLGVQPLDVGPVARQLRRHRVERERLHQVLGGPERDRGPHHLDVPGPGHHDHVGGVAGGAHAAQHLEPVGVGQVHVQQHQVDGRGGEQAHGLRAGAGGTRPPRIPAPARRRRRAPRGPADRPRRRACGSRRHLVACRYRQPDGEHGALLPAPASARPPWRCTACVTRARPEAPAGARGGELRGHPADEQPVGHGRVDARPGVVHAQHQLVAARSARPAAPGAAPARRARRRWRCRAGCPRS